MMHPLASTIAENTRGPRNRSDGLEVLYLQAWILESKCPVEIARLQETNKTAVDS